MPHIVVKYDDESGSKTYCDSQLPHRGFDGHIRVGVHDGKPTSEAKEYIDARNSTLENRVFAVPGTGRLEELKRAYTAANPEGKGKGKNAAKSKIRAKEAEQNFLNGAYDAEN